MTEKLTTIFNLIAGLASIFGLVFSIKAWKRAQGAERAAREAREALRVGNAAEDLQRLAAMGKELLACVQQNQIEAARLRCRDLASGISQARRRWELNLSAETGQRLGDTRKGVVKVSNSLSARGVEITEEERGRLLKFCHEVLRILDEEAGIMMSIVERR